MIWFYILIVVMLLQLPILYYFPTPPKMKEDMIYDICIVLGCPTKDDGSISRMQKSRMDKAIRLYREGKIKKLLISGAGVKNNFVEADVMTAYALSCGVTPTDIIKEKKARNTYDNLRFAKALCDMHHVQHVVVVSSCFHIRRSSFFVRKFFDTYAMCPTDEKEKIKHYISEYFRMWNTLYFEIKLKLKNR